MENYPGEGEQIKDKALLFINLLKQFREVGRPRALTEATTGFGRKDGDYLTRFLPHLPEIVAEAKAIHGLKKLDGLNQEQTVAAKADMVGGMAGGLGTLGRHGISNTERAAVIGALGQIVQSLPEGTGRDVAQRELVSVQSKVPPKPRLMKPGV